MGIANDPLTTPGVDDVLPRMGKDIAGFHFQCQHMRLKPVPVGADQETEQGVL
jgi:hypothetical protein